MRRIFIASLCAALAAACSAPEPDTDTEGVHLASADKVNGVTGHFVATNGIRFDFASVVDDEGIIRSTITHEGKVVLDSRVAPEVRELVVGGIDVAAVIRTEGTAGLAELGRFRDTELAIAIMQFPAMLKDELGVTDGEILHHYHSNYSLARMMIESLTGRVLEPEYRVVAPTSQAYGCTDECKAHGSDYYQHSDGSYDHISNDLTTCLSGGSTGGSGGGDTELQEFESAYGCHGCCGAGCWGCSGIYTPACRSHDDCVDRYGHLLCLNGANGRYASLKQAARSMFQVASQY